MSTIDTKSIVSQLMAVERRPQDLLNNRLSSLKSAQTAWGQISDKLNSLKTAAEAIAPTGSLHKMVAVTSDDPTVVGVTATGAIGNATSASIEVTQLASAHSIVMADTFASSTASDGGRTLDVVINGDTHSFSSDDGTIGGLAREINAAGVGVSARVLQTSSGNYQLALTSTTTGAASAFTVTPSGWTGASSIARQAADAQLKVDGVSVSRSSNTISDVIDGVQLTLKAKTTSPIMISAQRDDDTIVTKVKNLVDAANAALTTVGTATASSVTASSRGVLSTDAAAKSVAARIRNFVAQGVTNADGSTTSASLLGVSLSRDGKIEFDEAALRSSLTDNADQVFAALGRGGTSSLSGVTVTSVSGTAVETPHVVTVTRAAAQASMVGAISPPPPDGSTVSMTVVTPTGTQTVQFQAGGSYGETAANMTVALRGVGVKVTVNGVEDTPDPTQTGHFEISTVGYGSNQLLDFSGAGAVALGIDGTAVGEDAEMTIDGTSHTAAGQSLLKDGVAYNVTYTQGELDASGGTAAGTVRISAGFAGGLSLIGADGSSTGAAARAKSSLADRVTDLETRISQWDDRLSMRQTILERRFTVMDQMLAKLSSISTSLGLTSTSA